jgi:hypothetical protein
MGRGIGRGRMGVTMLRVVPCGLLVGFLLASTAFARAPSLEELPTVKVIQEQAGVKIEEARRAAAEAQKDPKKERIDAYANGTATIFEWKEIVDVLKGDSEQTAYRQAAADAIGQRFENVAPSDTRMDKLKREIALSILKLLNDKERQVRIWAHKILVVFWPGRAQHIGFNPEAANARERYDAYKAWQKWLSSGR